MLVKDWTHVFLPLVVEMECASWCQTVVITEKRLTEAAGGEHTGVGAIGGGAADSGGGG